MSSLGEALPQEQARCRRLVETYVSLRGPGVNVEFAIAMINDALTRAEQAVMSGDVVAMIQVYEELKSFE